MEPWYREFVRKFILLGLLLYLRQSIAPIPYLDIVYNVVMTAIFGIFFIFFIRPIFQYPQNQ